MLNITSFSGAGLTGSQFIKSKELTTVVLVILIRRRIPRKTGTRMPPSRIFMPSLNRMTKIRGNPALTTLTQALPKRVEAGRSDYMEVSTKFPGAHLEGFWKVWESFNVHPRVVIVLKQAYCLQFKQKPPLTRVPLIK